MERVGIRARRSWPSLVVVIVVGITIAWLAAPQKDACEHELRHGDQRRAGAVCLARYYVTANVQYWSWTAESYMSSGFHTEARAIAGALASGPLFGDAHRILSYEDASQGAHTRARLHASIALVAHASARDMGGLTRDALQLSHIEWIAGAFASALVFADEALAYARQLDDRHLEVSAQNARSDALRLMGDLHGAANVLRQAIERARTPCDRAWANLKSGLCRMQAEQGGLALLDLAAAASANATCGARAVSLAVAMNEAWLLRGKDPEGALARLARLDVEGKEEVEILLLRAYLAADRGALEEADAYLTRAMELQAPDADWAWELARARAELFELRDDDARAELFYRRAIALIEALRTTSRARSAYFVARHRGPYDGLIGLLARHGRWRDVLAVVLQLDASDMLRATADELSVPGRGSFDFDDARASRIAVQPASVEAVLTAWRARDLVIVIAPSPRRIGAGRERVYRVRIDHGAISGDDVGDANTARAWANDLFADPGDRVAAAALGAMFVPPGTSSQPLDVLAIGALGKVPLAALRDANGVLSLARRPLMRVLAVRAQRPDAIGSGPPTVIADARGDLPNAAIEGIVVTSVLGPSTQVSGLHTKYAATRDRLWAAHDAQLLHIAGHVGELGRWRALHLADGDVDPAEIVQRHFAPRIAVLAGCGSAAAFDEEGWGSLASALLESGTTVVLATDRSVGDDVALAIMSAFYTERDWRTSPALALARVQQQLDTNAAGSTAESVQARAWAAFSVLGRPPVIATELAAASQDATHALADGASTSSR